MIRRNTAILFGVFIVLLAGTLFWQRTRQSSLDANITPTSELDLLVRLQEDAIKGLIVQDRTGARVQIERSEDGKWVLLVPKADAADENPINTAITRLLDTKITNRPQTIASLEAVGLDHPSFSILLNLKDGEQFLINVGNATPTDSGYYVLTPDRVIYVVGKFDIDTVLGLLEDPPVLLTPTPLETLESSPLPGDTEAIPTVEETIIPTVTP